MLTDAFFSDVPPMFPEQFSARVKVTAHLVDPAKGYPPSWKDMDVFYDSRAGRAKVVIHGGKDASTIFLRLYNSKKEYLIRGGGFAFCRRSYLGEMSGLLIE